MVKNSEQKKRELSFLSSLFGWQFAYLAAEAAGWAASAFLATLVFGAFLAVCFFTLCFGMAAASAGAVTAAGVDVPALFGAAGA